MSLTMDAAAEERWSAARGIADGVIDARMPRRRRTTVLWICALAAVTALIGIALALLLPRGDIGPSDGDGDGTFAARIIAALAFGAAGGVIVIVSLTRAIRTKRFVTRWRSVAAPLNPTERKWVGKQIRTGSFIDNELRRTVVLAFAAQSRRVILVGAPLYLGIVLNSIAAAILSFSPILAWLELIVVLLIAVVGMLLGREYRRAGTYLEQFGTLPPTPGSAGVRVEDVD